MNETWADKYDQDTIDRHVRQELSIQTHPIPQYNPSSLPRHGIPTSSSSNPTAMEKPLHEERRNTTALELSQIGNGPPDHHSPAAPANFLPAGNTAVSMAGSDNFEQGTKSALSLQSKASLGSAEIHKGETPETRTSAEGADYALDTGFYDSL